MNSRESNPIKNSDTDKTAGEDILKSTASKPGEKVAFWCTECGQKYILPHEFAGKAGVCFKCHNYMFIPEESQLSPPAIQTVVFPCKYCGKKIKKLRKHIGTKVKCGDCGEKNTVPEKSKVSSLAKSGKTDERILFWCDYCGQKYRLPQHLAGKSGNCDRCHNDFIIPEKSQKSPKLEKTIVFPCVHCGQKQWVKKERIGERINCHECNGENDVPEKLDASPLVKKEERILFWCEHCGQKYRLPKKMGGKTGFCDVCHNDLPIPKESQVKPKRKETIEFPCEHCGTQLKKSKDLVGSEVRCNSCGRGNIVPEKSQKSLLDIVSSQKAFVTEATKISLVIPQATERSKDTPDSIVSKPHSGAKFEYPKKKTPVEIKKEPSRTALDSDAKADKVPSGNKIPIKVIPPSRKIAETIATEIEGRVLFWCAYCEQKYRLPKRLGGKKGVCDSCHNDLPIPKESQTEPKLLEGVINFRCEDCGKKQWKSPELVGTKTTCTECGKENTVPGKTKESLIEKVSPVKLRNAFIVTEATRTDLVVVGRPVPQKREIEGKPKNKVSSAKFHKHEPAEEMLETKLSRIQEEYTAPQIIITEEPPTIHKLKNYFQQKAEKYFIFAIFVIFIDYLIETYGDGRRPSKTFIIFASFTVAATMLLATWNYATYVPPDKSSKCQYNTVCTNPKCKLAAIIRCENVTEQKCSKCSSQLGLAYRCRECGKSFIFDEVKSKKELKARNYRIAKRKAKWHGGKPKVEDTILSGKLIKKCPECRSEDVYYVTVKQAKEEAAAKEAAESQDNKEKKSVKKKVPRKKKKRKKRL